MKIFFVLFLIGVTFAHCSDNTRCRTDCLYVNFDYLLRRYQSVQGIQNCVAAIPSTEKIHEIVYNIGDYGSDMHTNGMYVHDCVRTEFNFRDLRSCQKPIIELIEMGAGRMLEFFNQLRDEIKVVGNSSQITCVNRQTQGPMTHFKAALEC